MDYTGVVLYDPKHIGFGFRLGPNANPKISGILQFREDFPETLSTEDYANELQKAYDVKTPLQVCLYKQGELILMPRTTQSHAEWLKQHGHNIKTDKIVLIPKSKVSSFKNKYLPTYSKGAWDSSKTSPYFAEFKLFIDAIESTLTYHSVINKRSDINTILRLSEANPSIDTLDKEIYLLSKTNLDGTPSSRVNWNKAEETLNTWLVRILNNIESSSRIAPKDKGRVIQSIKAIFNNYYEISGYKFKHPLYRDAKLTLYQVGEVLTRIGAMTTFSIEKLDELLKTVNKPGVSSLYRNLQRNSESRPRTTTVEALRDNIILAATSAGISLTKSHEKLIQDIFNAYRDKVNDFRLAKNQLSGYDRTYRLELIQDLIDKCGPLRHVLAISIRDFNKLVFKKDHKSFTGGFLNPSNARDRPMHNTIFEIIYNSDDWSTKTFKDLGISMSYSELRQMRADIKNLVFDWIIKAKFRPALFNTRLLRTSNSVAPELDLVYSLWVAARRKTGSPKCDFEAIYKLRLLGDSPIQYNLKEGSVFSEDSLKLFKLTIQKWLRRETDIRKPSPDRRKVVAYEKALNKIGFYAQIRKKDLRGSPKGRSPSTRGEFNKEQAKVYNVILGLGRHLGFDPAFFRPVEDQMFDMNAGVKQKLKALGKKLYIYVRHHFKNNPDRASISIMDQVITHSGTHFYWENLISEDEALVAIQVLENLVKYNRRIDATDIKNEFKKFDREYRWIMANWLNDPDFDENLKKFNDRKDDIKAMTIDEFIYTHYRKTYDKFIKVLLKTEHIGILAIIQAMHPNVDVSGLVSLGKNSNYIGPYSTVFAEILKMYKYPVY